MRGRHPHVFGPDKLDSAEEVKELWAELKKRESGKEEQGVLAGVPLSAPALMVAQRMASRAAKAGVKPPLEESLPTSGLEDQDLDSSGEALGQHLFALAALAKAKGVDAESCLRKINREFSVRVSWMEKVCSDQGRTLEELSSHEIQELWQKSAQHTQRDARN